MCFNSTGSLTALAAYGDWTAAKIVFPTNQHSFSVCGSSAIKPSIMCTELKPDSMTLVSVVYYDPMTVRKKDESHPSPAPSSPSRAANVVAIEKGAALLYVSTVDHVVT